MNRPDGWDNPHIGKRSHIAQSEAYEAGADAMRKAIQDAFPTVKELRIKLLDVQFGGMSVPEFAEWLKEKLLIK